MIPYGEGNPSCFCPCTMCALCMYLCTRMCICMCNVHVHIRMCMCVCAHMCGEQCIVPNRASVKDSLLDTFAGPPSRGVYSPSVQVPVQALCIREQVCRSVIKYWFPSPEHYVRGCQVHIWQGAKYQVSGHPDA